MSPHVVKTPKPPGPSKVILNCHESESKLSYPVAHEYLTPRLRAILNQFTHRTPSFSCLNLKSYKDEDAEIIRILVILFLSIVCYISLLLL